MVVGSYIRTYDRKKERAERATNYLQLLPLKGAKKSRKIGLRVNSFSQVITEFDSTPYDIRKGTQAPEAIMRHLKSSHLLPGKI